MSGSFDLHDGNSEAVQFELPDAAGLYSVFHTVLIDRGLYEGGIYGMCRLGYDIL